MRDGAGISVIMPCYNTHAAELREAVQSILYQNFTTAPFEILIVDDASINQNTLEELDKLEKLSDTVQIIRRDENCGQSAARNLGVRYAQYDYLLPIDSDDALVVPDFAGGGYLHKGFEALENNPDAAVAYCESAFTGSRSGKFYIPPFSEKLLLLTDVIPVYGMHRRTDALAMGGYDEAMTGFEDWEYWVRLFNERYKKGEEAGVVELEGQYYLYRQHPDENNVHATHNISYLDVQRYMTRKNPEIYKKHFPGISLEELPEHMRKKAANIVQRLPADLSDDAREWLDQNWARISLFEQSTQDTKQISRTLQSPRTFLKFLAEVQKDPIQYFRTLAEESQYGVSSIRADKQNIHFIADPELARDIASAPQCFQKAGDFLTAMSFFGGEGIFSSHHELWQRQRSLITPHFNKTANYDRLPETMRLIDESLEQWREMDYIEPYSFCRAFAFRVFAKTVMGEDIDLEESNKIARAIDQASTRIASHLMDPRYYMTGEMRNPKHATKRDFIPLVRFIDRVISKRLNNDKQPPDKEGDVVCQMLNQIKQSTQRNQVHQQAREEVQHLLLAGHETTGAALAWALHLLARNMSAQEKLIDEIPNNLSGSTITDPDQLRTLPYLQQIIKETLRMHPPLCVSLARQVKDNPGGDFERRGRAKGDLAFVLIDAMHNNPNWFQKSDQFIPERFNDGAEKAWPKGAYLPFFTGAHACPGKMMAIQEVGVALTAIFSKYRLVPDNNNVAMPIYKEAFITTPSSESELKIKSI